MKLDPTREKLYKEHSDLPKVVIERIYYSSNHKVSLLHPLHSFSITTMENGFAGNSEYSDTYESPEANSQARNGKILCSRRI